MMLHLKYKGVDHLIMYFAILLIIAVVFSYSNRRKLMLIIYHIILFLYATHYTERFGHFSEYSFSETSNIQTQIIFLIGSLYLCITLVNKSKENYQKISQLVNRLQSKNEELEISNKKLEQFTYLASHDLKAPLNSIHSFAELIDSKLENGKLKSLPKYTQVILKNVEQMKVLISESLQRSKVDYVNSLKEKEREIDLNKLVEHISLTLKANHNHLKITWDELPIITAIYSDVFKICQNLMENGIKYNTNKTKRLHISAHVGIKENVLLFNDNGVGIGKKDQTKIFENKVRLNQVKNVPGFGLGLSIVKELVDEMGGAIKVTPNLDQGSCFILSIPKQVYRKSEVVQGLGSNK